MNWSSTSCWFQRKTTCVRRSWNWKRMRKSRRTKKINHRKIKRETSTRWTVRRCRFRYRRGSLRKINEYENGSYITKFRLLRIYQDFLQDCANDFTFLMYSSLLFLYKFNGSCCAGLSIFGSSFNNFWIPNSICFTVMCGFQSYSSFKIDRQTVPEGYMFGCGNTGLNMHFGGLTSLIIT